MTGTSLVTKARSRVAAELRNAISDAKLAYEFVPNSSSSVPWAPID